MLAAGFARTHINAALSGSARPPAASTGEGPRNGRGGTARTVARTHAARRRTRRIPPERASAVGIHACSAAPRRRRTATGRESWYRCVRGEPQIGRGHARRGCSRRSTAAATCSCFARRTYAGPAQLRNASALGSPTPTGGSRSRKFPARKFPARTFPARKLIMRGTPTAECTGMSARPKAVPCRAVRTRGQMLIRLRWRHGPEDA